MVQEERCPALRRWAPVSGHVLCNRSLADIDAELEEFSMNARSAPERVCQAHLADQLPNFEGHLGPAGSPSRLPAPEAANPARCHRTIVSGRTIVTASRTVGASRYSNTKIKRSKDVRAGRLGALRRSTFNWCRSAIISPSSELLDRKRSRSIHLSRLKSSSTRRSSPDSDAQAKRMGFAVGTPRHRQARRASLLQHRRRQPLEATFPNSLDHLVSTQQN